MIKSSRPKDPPNAMTIRMIRTFVQIAKLGSFTKAARHLAMTQSTVSLQMKSLEEKLRVELFDRSGRRPTLNAKGRTFLKKAVQLIELYDEMVEDISNYDELIGALHIGAVNTVMSGILPDALLALRTQHPGLETHISSGLSQNLMYQLDAGEIDAALISEPPLKLDDNLNWSTICSEPLVLITPITSELNSEQEFLKKYPFIRFDRQAWAGQIIDKELRRRKIEVQDVMKLDSLETISLMVSRGLGVSIVPERRIEQPFPVSLNVIPFGDKPTYRHIGLLVRRDSSCSSLTNALYQALISTIRKT
jgi:DNA-binding transcriptional LysR family regulator